MVPISLIEIRYRANKVFVAPDQLQKKAQHEGAESEAKTVNDTSIDGNYQPGNCQNRVAGTYRDILRALDEGQGITRVNKSAPEIYHDRCADT
jgi:hypothetical protein